MADMRKLQTPTPEFEQMTPVWKKCRVVVSGQRAVLSHDKLVTDKNNLLIPFSPTMDQAQFDFYKREAELPGVNSQFVKLLAGGLLRKPPVIEYSDKVSQEARDWIENSISVDSASLISFLDTILNEELVTSRTWIYVEYPNLPEDKTKLMSQSDWLAVKPYPLLWVAEQVLRTQTAIIDGIKKLTRVVVKGLVEEFETELDVHPKYVDTIWVHELIGGLYQIRVFKAHKAETIIAATGELNKAISTVASTNSSDLDDYKLEDTLYPKMHGERMKMIPAWPANGNIDIVEPELATIVDKEVALYNKISRRNHLLYGAATYTPWISSDMSHDDFKLIVKQGLGTWIHLDKGDTIGALTTPTEALTDLDTAIKAGLDEISKLGVRMLANEDATQSGVALQLRSASQTAFIGSFNTKLSAVVRDVLIHMINRRYPEEIVQADLKFTLCSDFDTIPLGSEWIKLMGEYYEKNLIPRSAWIELLKANDLLKPEYDDKIAKTEIDEDELTTASLAQNESGLDTASKIKAREAQRKASKGDNNDSSEP